MDRAFVGDLQHPSTLFFGEATVQSQDPLDLIDLADVRFAVFAILRVNFLVAETDFDGFQGQFFVVRVNAERHRGASAETCEEVIVRTGAEVGSADAFGFVRNEGMTGCEDITAEAFPIEPDKGVVVR